MTTATDIVNEALMLAGGITPLVTGTAPTFDNSANGKAAALLYGPTVAAVGRQFGWDFARHTVALVLTGNVAPYPWALEYGYPADGIEILQLTPMTEADPNDPLPVNFIVANNVVGAFQKRVIQTNLANAQAVYNNNPLPDAWDALFHQAVVRLLASGLSMAIGGKPDLAQSMLEGGSAFESVAEGRRD